MEDLKELAWVILLLDMIAVLCGVVLAQYLGRTGMLGVGFGALITGTLTAIATANLLVIWALRLRDRRRRRAEALSSMVPR